MQRLMSGDCWALVECYAYIEVDDETQKMELARWDKAEKQNDIRSDIAKKLENI